MQKVVQIDQRTNRPFIVTRVNMRGPISTLEIEYKSSMRIWPQTFDESLFCPQTHLNPRCDHKGHRRPARLAGHTYGQAVSRG